MPGVGGRVLSQTSNFVGENVHKGGENDDMYSAGDCGISIVILTFIYYFRDLE